MQLFRSEEHVDRYLEGRGISRGAVFGVDQLWGLAKTWYENRMAPDWRRRTPEEAEAVFENLGLRGDFWSLT